MRWDPRSALDDVAADRVDGVAPAYDELLGRCPVAHVAVPGSSIDWWGVFSHADIAKVAVDHRVLSNVTPPPGGPRIIPLQTDPPEHTA